MIKIQEAVIVEGKYDKMRVRALFDTAVIETGGFRVFNDAEKRAVIRELALSKGVVILTDSDGAGLVIRGFLKGAVPEGCVKQAYVPEVEGKEKRKEKPSKQGLLGVEGMTDDVIVQAVLRSGVHVIGESEAPKNELTKADLYELGLTGRDNSATLRRALLKSLGFPQYMTANALLSALKLMYTREELERSLRSLSKY